MSGVNNPAGEADSCKVLISLRIPLAGATEETLDRNPWTSKENAGLLCAGIVLSGCAVMQRVAETLHERGLSSAKMSSIERRLAHFIANERIVVPLIWKLFLVQVLAPFRGQQHFVLDITPFRDDLRLCIWACWCTHGSCR
jgi:hypothetical protein